MEPEWLGYEKFVRDITEAMLRADGITDVNVQHDVQLPGASRSVQVDVYWQYRMGGVLHRVLINCKKHGRPVDAGSVNMLIGVLRQFPGARGALVSPVGYTSGAIADATHGGVNLFVIRPPVEEDYEGRVRVVELTIEITPPDLLSWRPFLDGEWMTNNLTKDERALFDTARGPVLADLVVICDRTAGTTEDFNDFWNRLMAAHGTCAIDEIVSQHIDFADATIALPDLPTVKLAAVDISWTVRRGAAPVTVRVEGSADAVVRDILEGSVRFINLAGE